MRSINTNQDTRCEQPDQGSSTMYETPQIILELDLEIKAGSSLGIPGDIFDE